MALQPHQRQIARQKLNVSDYISATNPVGNGDLKALETKCINILLVGRTRSGKSTLVKSLIDAREATQMSSYSETMEPRCYRFIIQNPQANICYQFNIIDTPGLGEVRRNPGENRSDQVLLDLSRKCMEENITVLNAVCFVSKVGSTNIDDVQIFQKIIEYLGDDCKKVAMMILTHCDTLMENALEALTQELKEADAPNIKQVVDYCQQGIFKYGALNSDTTLSELDNVERGNQAGVLERKLQKIQDMRTALLEKFFALEGYPMPIKRLKPVIEASKKAIDEELSRRTQSAWSNFLWKWLPTL